MCVSMSMVTPPPPLLSSPMPNLHHVTVATDSSLSSSTAAIHQSAPLDHGHWPRTDEDMTVWRWGVHGAAGSGAERRYMY